MESLLSIFGMFADSISLIFAYLSHIQFLGFSILNILITGFVLALVFNAFSRLGGVSIGSKDKGGKND